MGEGRWIAGSLAAIAALVGLYAGILHVTNPTIVALSLLLIVFATAAQSLRAAIVASIAATACFNFFFLPPTGTFTIAEPENWFALFTFLVTSVVVSRLSAQARARAREAEASRDELARLFDLTRDILLTTEAADPIAAMTGHIVRRFRFAGASVFRRHEGRWTQHASSAPMPVDRAVLDAVLDGAMKTLEFDARARAYSGASEIALPDGAAWLVPLRLGPAAVGVLALQGAAIAPGTRDAIAGIIAIAIERQQLLEERKEAEIVRRSADLRSALLASLSHDLRTPLTAVAIASANLDAPSFSAAERREQVDVIRTEVARLNRLFENIVDMARIETHAIRAAPQWTHPAEIIETARHQAGAGAQGRPIGVNVDPGMAVNVDPRLTSAALAHLIENAVQYSPETAPIEIHAWREADELRVSVRDRGAGIAPEDLSRIFDRFYRGASGQRRFGTGMGLAIARGLLAAQGGRVWAENAADGGARFTMAIPSEARPAARADEMQEADA